MILILGESLLAIELNLMIMSLLITPTSFFISEEKKKKCHWKDC